MAMLTAQGAYNKVSSSRNKDVANNPVHLNRTDADEASATSGRRRLLDSRKSARGQAIAILGSLTALLRAPAWAQQPSVAQSRGMEGAGTPSEGVSFLDDFIDGDSVFEPDASLAESVTTIPVGSYGLAPPRTISVRAGIEF